MRLTQSRPFRKLTSLWVCEHILKVRHMKERIPMIAIIVLVAAGLFLMLNGMMSPEMYRAVGPSKPVNYVFVPDYDEPTGQKHYVEGSFWSTRGDSVTPIVFYRSPGKSYTEARLQQIVGSNKFSFPMPSLEKGKRYFYFIRVEDSRGNTVDIKPKPNFADRVLAHGREKLFYVTYEGRPLRPLLLLHIALIIGAMFLMIHGLKFSLSYVLSGRGLSAAYWSFFVGWVLFTITVLPLGISIAKTTFGVGWTGFPLGTDITDNKSLIVVFYWLILLAIGWRPLRGDYSPRTGRISGSAFVGLSLIGIFLTILAHAIPHSVFVQ